MTLRARRIIYITFIIIFLIVAPLLLLYTAGFRYNVIKGKVERTGALVIDSIPDDVSVYINDELRAKKTPARIQNLLSNEYAIRVEKEGYTTWQKRLDIFSKETTFAENIILFKKQDPSLEIEGNINLLAISPNKVKIAYSIIDNDKEEIWCWNLRSNEKELLLEYPLTVKDTEITWLEDSEKILISQKEGLKTNHLVINTKKADEKISLSQIAGFDLENVKIEPKDSNVFYSQRQNIIYEINLFTRRVEELAKIKVSAGEKILDYIVKDDEVYYIKMDNEKSLLEKIKIIQQDSTTPVSNLPYWSNAKIKEDKSDAIIILNEEKQKIIVINPDPEFAIYKELDAKDISWNESYDKLLYYNDLEIWSYDIWNLEAKTDELFTRYGQIINESQWYPELGYIIFSLENSINVIEPDPRDKRNIDKLVEAEEIKQFVIGPRGKDIYLIGKINEVSGIYKLNIQ